MRFLTGDRDLYRDPQLANMQRIEDCGMLHLNEISISYFFPQDSETILKEELVSVYEPEKDDNYNKTVFLELHKVVAPTNSWQCASMYKASSILRQTRITAWLGGGGACL